MKQRFEEVAEKNSLPLIYAGRGLANIKIDDFGKDDFSKEGYLLLVSPLRASLGVDDFGRSKPSFEVGVIALMEFDYDEEDVDDIVVTASALLRRILKELGADYNVVNIFTSTFDANVGGVFANINLKSTETVCYEQAGG